MEAIVVFGQIGSDAGYWYLGSDGKIHHVPGWNPETMKAFETIAASYKTLRAASRVEGGIAGKVAGLDHGINMAKEMQGKELQ
jgi:hypothetical protein